MTEASAKTSSNGQQAGALALIATKLFIPPAHPGLVPRPRLIQRLNEGLTRKLILISAPAGFGKTTLLSEWRSAPPARELPFAWVSLDEGDNDPARFWSYVIAALQTIQPGVGDEALQALRASAASPAEAMLPSLINDLAALEQDFCLVLDDYHLICTEAVHQGLAFLLAHLPPRMPVIISSRIDPPLPLSLLRGRGQLIEVREEALRFTVEEMTAFLNDTIGLNLPAEQITALHALTEGWVAGVQMAALSLRGHKDKAGFIRQFSGSHRHIADYLLEQVLERQPEEVQWFLLHTAILQRLCGPLCDGVTAQGGGQAMLERLEASNLFLIPLDDERRWYRYQHLFADLLRSRLQHAQPARMRELQQRAAKWLEQNGLTEEAIPHALGASDFVKAADLIASVIDVVWNKRREVATVLHWLQALPAQLMRARLPLRVWYVSALTQVVSDVDTLDHLTQDAEALLTQAATEADLDQILRLVYARINVLGARGNLVQAIQLAERARRQMPEGYLVGQRAVYYRLGVGRAYLINGEALAAEREYLEASKHIDLAPYAGPSWAIIQRLRGSLRQAAATLAQAFEAMRDVPPWPAHANGHMYFAGIRYEWDDLAGAVAHLQQAVAIFREWYVPHRLAEASWWLAQAYWAQGDVACATDAMQQALSAAREVNDPDCLCLSPVSLRALQAHFDLRQGRLAEAGQWADTCGLSLDDEPGYRQLWDHLTLTRVALVRGQAASVLPLLARLRQQAAAQGRMGHAIQILALQAMALQALGQTDEAITMLIQALSLAEPEGFIRTFVDEGEPMAHLLHQLARRNVATGYIARLLAAFSSANGEARTSPVQPLVEPLTEREQAVLRLVSQGLSNREVAGRLVVTVGTVKDHLIHIFQKLDVRSRTQAAARAHELKLL